jgi:hypothetical protein
MNKRIITVGILLTGVIMTFSAGLTSSKVAVNEVQALSEYLYTFDTNGSYTSGISDGVIPSERISTSNTGEAIFSVSFYKNNSSTTSIFNNSAGETRLYGGSGNGGQLTFTLSDDYVMKTIKVNTSTNNGYSINDGSKITAADVETPLSDLTSVTVKNVASGTDQVRITSLEIGYSPSVTKIIQSISINDTSTHDTTFSLWDNFSTAGLKINAIYESDDPEVLTTGFTVTGVNTSVLGKQVAEVDFQGERAYYDVFVTNNGAIVIDSSPEVNAADLIISEYVEGDGNNKAIEIFNGTGASVDLSEYDILIYANGLSTATSTISLTGSLVNNMTYVIAHSSSVAGLKNLADLESGALGFNGDDAIVLRKGSSYIDILGKIGEDPGTAWTSGSHSTLDKTLVRKPSVIDGITQNPASGFPTLATEWDVYPQDTFDYIGSHIMDTGSIPFDRSEDQAIAFSNWIMSFESGDLVTAECSTKYDIAVLEWGYMATESQDFFSSDAAFADARNRLSNWAIANGDSIIWDPLSWNQNDGGTMDSIANQGNLFSLISILVLISLGASLIGYYYIISRKKVKI